MPFTDWETFYVIVGSSAGALTGLMFVVMALVVDFRSSEQQIEAFGTPTVVHFCGVLLLSAVMSAPWPRRIRWDSGGRVWTATPSDDDPVRCRRYHPPAPVRRNSQCLGYGDLHRHRALGREARSRHGAVRTARAEC